MLIILLLLATSVAAGPAANEHILIGGRVRVQSFTEASPVAKGGVSQVPFAYSRRFEVTLSRRNGRLVSAEACLFSDLTKDKDWDGGCFRIPPDDLDEHFTEADWQADHLPTVHLGAQNLLRLLAENSEREFGGHLIIGYDPTVDIEIAVAKFGQTDL